MSPALSLRMWPLVAALLSTAASSPAPAAPAPAPAATTPAPRPEDVATPESLVAALYDVLSGPKGQARDWNRFRSLFLPGARMIPSGKRKDGTFGHRLLTPEDYITGNEKMLVDQGFRERELHRVEERFGPLVHVFTTYEAFHEGEDRPFMRGINSIQLLNDGKRWWILTVAWTPETPEQPLPAKYLPPAKG